MSKDTKQWQPIATAPKDELILALRDDGSIRVVYWAEPFGEAGWYLAGTEGTPTWNLTHWTSIPPFDGEGEQQ